MDASFTGDFGYDAMEEALKSIMPWYIENISKGTKISKMFLSRQNDVTTSFAITKKLSSTEEMITHMEDNKDELVVSIYKLLDLGTFRAFPVEDAVLYAENVTCGEILPYMNPRYSKFDCELIWTKIKHDRDKKGDMP